MSLSNKDDNLNLARKILPGKRISGAIGKSDKVDFYKLDLSQPLEFALSFDRFKGRASAQVKLLNSEGSVLSKFKLEDKRSTFQSTLAAGRYYIKVELKGRSDDKVDYKFATTVKTAEPGETAATARNIGTLSGSYINQDIVGADDGLDYYKFSLDQISKVDFRLGKLSQGVYLYLYYDANNNGVFEERSFAYNSGNAMGDAFISDTLPKGDYLIQVDDSGNSTNTRYELTLNSTPTPGNLLTDLSDNSSTAYDLGLLSGAVTTSDLVGDLDGLDYYKFSLNQISKVDFKLGGLTQGVYLYLYYDADNNGVFEERSIAYDFGSASGEAFISRTLLSGNYLLQVDDSGNSQNTRYELIVSPS